MRRGREFVCTLLSPRRCEFGLARPAKQCDDADGCQDTQRRRLRKIRGCLDLIAIDRQVDVRRRVAEHGLIGGKLISYGVVDADEFTGTVEYRPAGVVGRQLRFGSQIAAGLVIGIARIKLCKKIDARIRAGRLNERSRGAPRFRGAIRSHCDGEIGSPCLAGARRLVEAVHRIRVAPQIRGRYIPVADQAIPRDIHRRVHRRRDCANDQIGKLGLLVRWINSKSDAE